MLTLYDATYLDQCYCKLAYYARLDCWPKVTSSDQTFWCMVPFSAADTLVERLSMLILHPTDPITTENVAVFVASILLTLSCFRLQ